MRAETHARRVDRLRHPVNKAIHSVCVPTITWTVLALLWSVPAPAAFAAVPYLNWGTLFAALATLYYLSLSLTLTAGMAAFAALCFWLIAAYPAQAAWPLWQFALAVFATAWVFQFIGHAVEGRRPSFFKDVQFLLIGPAWVLRRAGLPC